MFYGLNRFIKDILPKKLFYRALLIVAIPVIVLQLVITFVFFDSLWIKTNKGMTRALVNEINTFIEVYNDEIYDKDEIKNIFSVYQNLNIGNTYSDVAIVTDSGAGSGARANVTTVNSDGFFNVAALASISQSGAGMAANRLTEYGRYIVMERVSGSQSPTVGKEGEKIVPSDAGTVSYANAGFMFYSGSSESNSKFFSVMGSGSVAREVVHQLDTFTGSVVLPGSEKIEFNGAGSGDGDGCAGEGQCTTPSPWSECSQPLK